MGTLVVVLTILPLWRTTKWWVRIWDFPRFQIFIMCLALLPMMFFLGPHTAAALTSAIIVAALWQFSWIWRYLPLSSREVRNAAGSDRSLSQITLLTANVCQDVRDAASLLTIISRADPDVVLAVETDDLWCAQLDAGLGATYPNKILHPLSNEYGLALFSRLKLADSTIRYLVDPSIPSIRTGVEVPDGRFIDLYGLHPPPPSPEHNTTKRDRELIVVGKEIKLRQRPSVVLGDLNDVAWSETTVEFKTTAGVLDPRRGRGFFSTFPAGWPGLRYPLDHIFLTPHFTLVNIRVLPKYRSDHLPLVATLQLGT
jgi:endonuclease/exonuclease/phosphatase (EEP) superfamily protein YafD